MIVLERNYFEVPEEEIADQQVLLTMVGGEVVYVADRQNFGERVKAKFPNNDAHSVALKARNAGGLEGWDMEEQEQLAARAVRARDCHHHH
jgi:hypothetical protein